jgi:phenylacetate-CoA ligase
MQQTSHEGGFEVVLPNYKVLDRKLETLSFEETVKLQENRLKGQVSYCYERTLFWRKKFDAIGLRPEDIKTLEDLTKIPFCTKEDLQKDQEENPPFGSYTAIHSSTWARYFSTSGTTGRVVNRIYSKRDWEYETKNKVKMIMEMRPAFVAGTASMLLYVGEVAAQMEVDLSKAGVRIVASVGEPGAAIKGTRERIMKTWGAQISDGYGITELFPLGGSCLHSLSLHIANDFSVTEVVDPKTGKVLGPRQRGELVYTNIIGDTQPLLRYRSRDIGELAKFGACECGSTATRIVNGIEGRVDDMI